MTLLSIYFIIALNVLYVEAMNCYRDKVKFHVVHELVFFNSFGRLVCHLLCTLSGRNRNEGKYQVVAHTAYYPSSIPAEEYKEALKYYILSRALTMKMLLSLCVKLKSLRASKKLHRQSMIGICNGVMNNDHRLFP